LAYPLEDAVTKRRDQCLFEQGFLRIGLMFLGPVAIKSTPRTDDGYFEQRFLQTGQMCLGPVAILCKHFGNRWLVRIHQGNIWKQKMYLWR
jgi:hypothetical protein